MHVCARMSMCMQYIRLHDVRLCGLEEAYQIYICIIVHSPFRYICIKKNLKCAHFLHVTFIMGLYLGFVKYNGYGAQRVHII